MKMKRRDRPQYFAQPAVTNPRLTDLFYRASHPAASALFILPQLRHRGRKIVIKPFAQREALKPIA
jgi:hypothetical protein